MQIQQWNKSNNIKANILIIHGLGEHQGRYNHVADYYTNHKFGVYSLTKEGMENLKEKEVILQESI